MHLLLEWELVFFAWQPLAPAPALALALASAPAPALLNWGRGKTSWGRQFGMPLFFSRQEAESGQSVMATWKALLPCQSNLAIYTQGMSKRQLSAPSGKCSGRHQGHVRRDHSSGLGRSHSQQDGEGV